MRFIILFFLFLFFSVTGQIENNNSYQKTSSELIIKGRKAFFRKDLKQLTEITNEVKYLYGFTKDSLLLAKIYHFKALENKLNYRFDSAYFNYYHSKEISLLLKDSIAVGRRLMGMANLQRQSNDLIGSEVSSFEALSFFNSLENYKYLSSVYTNLGRIYAKLEKEDKALKYFKKSLTTGNLIEEELKRESNKLDFLINMSFLYQEIDYEKSRYYAKEALSFKNIKSIYPIKYAKILENYVLSYEFKEKNEETLKCLFEVVAIKKEFNDYDGLSTTYLNLSRYYKETLDFVKAQKYANKSLELGVQSNNNYRLLDTYLMFSDLTKGEEAKKYLENYIELNEQIIDRERKLKNRFARIKYQTDKKEKENSLLKVENDKKEAEIVLHKQQKTISWLVIGLCVLFIISGFVFYTFRKKKLLYEAQLQKIEVREEERKQIAKSLHDEVAGDLRLLHRKLENSLLFEEAQKLDLVKENVRKLSHQLSSISFDKVSFKNQIINLVSDYFEPTFIIKIKGLKEPNWTLVKSPIKRLLYLSTRECIQNCQKYANASKVDVNFEVHKKNVFLRITDNGKGFDKGSSKKGIGLKNLEERVLELKGNLTIESESNAGTKIFIQIPLNV